MRRVLLSGVLMLAAAVFVFLATGAGSKHSAAGTYKIEFDDATGLVPGAQFEVAGVPAGSIQSIDLDQKNLHAVVTVQVTKPGFGEFHHDVSCQSRPEELIGEYYVDCNPGNSGPVLKPGSTIAVTHTQSTIPGDLLQDTMRLPYRQRLTMIINSLGAAAAARGGDLQAALQRAVPALTETDALLQLLGNDSTNLQNLTRDADSVMTALANNSKGVNRFIDEADRAATATATQQGNLRVSLARLPGLLEQLKPTMAKLGTTVTNNEPVLSNLHQAANQVDILFKNLPKFSRSLDTPIKPSSVSALTALGNASVTGKAAVTAAGPTVADLNQFAKPTPELAGNLAIVLQSLDTQSNAVERDPRSPGGKGFSGLQALLGYVFNQALAINAYGPEGHILAVDAFVSPMCSPYATPAYIAMALKQYGASYRKCYSWLGPSQPGVNETDPSDPSASVPDPGGAPPGETGPTTDARRLTAAAVQSEIARKSNVTGGASGGAAGSSTSSSSTSTTSATSTTAGSSTTGSSTSTTSTTSSSTSTTPSGPPIDLSKTVGQILAGSGSNTSSTSSASTPTTTSSSTSGGQAQQLLNYLLAP